MTDPNGGLSPLDEPPDAPIAELRRREDRWHATRRPDALWPGLDGAVIQAAAHAIGAVAAAVLRGERARLDFPSTGPDGARHVRALGVAGLLTGAGPLLGAWIARGELAADEPHARTLARHLAHGRARIARIRGVVLPVLERLERAGLAPGVIKGFHVAHAYFPEPGARPFHDVDVVVPPDAVAHAEKLLVEAGFIPQVRLGRTTYKREWLPPGGDDGVWSYELWHARSRWKLDLHDGLNFAVVMQNVRAPQTPRFADVLRLEGVTLRTADPNELIALVAAHGATELYAQRLLRLVEIVLVARHAAARGALDWSAVERSLAGRDSLRFAYPMLALAEQLAPGTVDGASLARLRAATTPRARALTEELSPTGPILEGSFSLRDRLLWAADARATIRRLWRMVAPLEGASTRDRLRNYRHRAMRLLALDRSSRGAPPNGTSEG